MKRLVVENKVKKRLKGYGRDRIVFANNFSDIGNAETINKALHRLKEKGIIIRLAQGIYLYPQIDEIIGTIYPTVEEIAQAIAKRDHARIIPTGIQALNKLGLSTQIPMNVVYLTDGAARSIRINTRTIKFKKTTPKNLAVKGEISSLVIQALREIGKDKLKPKQLVKIRGFLAKEKPEFVKHEALKAPAWIRKIMIDYLETRTYDQNVV
ncbi:MAG: hypothetical protein IIB45_09610 [Candidatus Marinimicrobia bacterium]|nr:hypothetical protein [Candidatus Neomarinimicrobiota bacterium]